jgi:hypothetical protein
MVIVPVELRKDALINAVIATVLREFSPEVKYIRYAIDQDWNGDWTIFFRVVLSAEIEAKEVRERVKFQNRIRDRIMREIDLPNLELWPSVNFRYEGEPVDSDPNWAPLPA